MILCLKTFLVPVVLHHLFLVPVVLHRNGFCAAPAALFITSEWGAGNKKTENHQSLLELID
jgi:hypothetical protein